VKRLLFATVTFVTICGGRLSASSVIDCSGTSGAINSCLASKLPNFQTQLDWAILGQPFNGSISNSPWSGSQDGINIQVTPTGSLGGSEGLRLAYNVGTIFYSPNANPAQWTLADSVPTMGYTHPGHFNATSTPAASVAALQADPTIHLLGLALSGGSTTEGLLLDFNNPFINLGFYGAAKGDPNFSLNIKIYSGAAGTGSLLSNDTFTYNSLSYTPGGTCASMQSAPFAPTGCNDAPFFYASGFNTGRSVLITSSDQTGFYLSNLYVGQAGEVPEPGPMALCGCGIALLALGRRKLRRKAE
jgi:hypothetical protein